MKLDRVIAVRNNKTIYRDGTRCIKVFNEDFSKADVLNEALNQSIVEETGLNIPKVIEVTTHDGKWAVVSEYIKGKTLAQLIKEDPERKAEYIEKLVDLQIQIHEKTSKKLVSLKSVFDRKIKESTLDATTRYDLRMRLESMTETSQVCHGDFDPTNVVITDEGEAYILDWSNATQGNALADVSRSYLLFWLSGDITGADMYLDLFCKKSDTPKQLVQKWMPIVAAAQSVEGNAVEREFLLSWVKVVDYQ